MKHFAIGWACNLNDIFVRFPYEKCKSLVKNFKTKQDEGFLAICHGYKCRIKNFGHSTAKGL